MTKKSSVYGIVYHTFACFSMVIFFMCQKNSAQKTAEKIVYYANCRKKFFSL